MLKTRLCLVVPMYKHVIGNYYKYYVIDKYYIGEYSYAWFIDKIHQTIPKKKKKKNRHTIARPLYSR